MSVSKWNHHCHSVLGFASTWHKKAAIVYFLKIENESAFLICEVLVLHVNLFENHVQRRCLTLLLRIACSQVRVPLYTSALPTSNGDFSGQSERFCCPSSPIEELKKKVHEVHNKISPFHKQQCHRGNMVDCHTSAQIRIPEG